MYEDYTPLAKWMKPHDPSANYGFFGYKGMGIELTIKQDDPEAIKEAHKRGLIAADTTTLINTPLRTHAERKGAPKVAAALAELGYPA